VDSLRKEYSAIDKVKVWFGEKSVVVFTMGKVGTLTVCNSLRNIGYRHVHPHSLRFTRPGIHFIKVKLSFGQNLKYKIMTIFKRIKVTIWKLLKKEIVIITGVRDPYSRNISAYFEQVHYLGGISEKATHENIEKQFNDSCVFNAPLNWFDIEIKRVTGIDVFEYPFDKDEGFCIISKGKYKLFVYRIDKLNSLSKELARFIGDDLFQILSTNSSEKGEYFDQLSELKKNYRYDSDRVKTYSESKYMKHFYTEAENQRCIEKWAK
jgi:hypothetical protein